MPQIERQPVVIKSNDGGAQPGALHVTVYSPRERVVRAAKVWAVCWVLALLALPIIGLHWILVPALTLAGVLLGYQRYRATTTSHKIEGLCPMCHSTIEIKLEPRRAPAVVEILSRMQRSVFYRNARPRNGGNLMGRGIYALFLLLIIGVCGAVALYILVYNLIVMFVN